MKFSELMAFFDYNMANVARFLGVSNQTISLWKQNNKVPFGRQCEIEIKTNGQLKADKD